MPGTKNGDYSIKLALGDVGISRMYLGDVKVYSSGNTVTYYVDADNYITEEWDSGMDVLNPSTFEPQKTGWTFVGWRADTKANKNVLSEKIMEDTPIVLYAVFQKKVTVTYYNNSTTASTSAKNRYYNNGNIVNPSFTLTQEDISGWVENGWSTNEEPDAATKYNNATEFERSSNITLYGKYYKTVTLSYDGNDATSGSVSSHSGIVHKNYAGEILGATFTLKNSGFTKTYYKFVKWARGSVNGTQYNAGATVTISGNATFYAIWNAATWITGSKFVLDPKTFTKVSGDANMSYTSPATIISATGDYGTRIVTRSGKLPIDKLRTIKITWKRTGAEAQPVYLSLQDQNNSAISGFTDVSTPGTYTVKIPASVTSICFLAQIYNDEGIEITSAVLS